MDKVTSIVIAGLGGQGVIKASDILAGVAFRAGHDVKKAEVHGMSQRGGSVTSDVRFGKRVLSPMVPAGEADFLVALEDSQVEPSRHFLRKSGKLLQSGMLDLAALPTAKALNVAMLGMLSVFLDIPQTTWLEAIRSSFPERLHAANEQAFQAGRTAAEKEQSHA
jgi:indolepyruvate ferredoxin oxidoreductase, beta subunit